MSDAKNELISGATCLRRGCVLCCIETEMPLTDEDLKRIEKLGFKRADFAVNVEGETRLRNVSKRCFFLENEKCTIYENRPEGCRIYPLVYDADSYKFIFDPVCPHAVEYKVTKEDKDRLKRLIRKIERKK